MCHEGERHDSTHRMGDPWCVTHLKRWPDDRKRATGPRTSIHCGRPPCHRRAGVGEIAIGRMVKRRHLPQRQVYRSDRLHERASQQNGSRLANGSPSRRQRRRRRLSRMARWFSSLNRRAPESGEGSSLRRLISRSWQYLKHRSRVRSYRFKGTECSVVRRGRSSCSLSCDAPAGNLRVCGLQRWK